MCWALTPFRFSIPPVLLTLLLVQVCPQYDLSRLSHLKSGGGKLQRRQDLPEEAFYLPADGELARVRDSFLKFFFVALSYRWLSQGTWWGRRKLRFNC